MPVELGPLVSDTLVVLSARADGARVRLYAEGDATLRITERGEIRSAFFRFMARFIFGYTSTMETYLRDLGTKFGEVVTPME